MNGWMNECMDALKKALRMHTILAFLNKPG